MGAAMGDRSFVDVVPMMVDEGVDEKVGAGTTVDEMVTRVIIEGAASVTAVDLHEMASKAIPAVASGTLPKSLSPDVAMADMAIVDIAMADRVMLGTAKVAVEVTVAAEIGVTAAAEVPMAEGLARAIMGLESTVLETMVPETTVLETTDLAMIGRRNSTVRGRRDRSPTTSRSSILFWKPSTAPRGVSRPACD